MANTKISQDPNATALTGAEQLAGVQSGGNVKITPNQIRTYINAVQNNPSGTSMASIDCDDINTGSMQLVSGDSTNAPTATSANRFIIFCVADGFEKRQLAIQLNGTEAGTIYERNTVLTVWSSWDAINT